MALDRVFKLRVRYVKANRLAMLSHLEVARTLERVIRRANLPYAVSQGFSPHMKIAFGAALPVGVGSTCEVFDLSLTAYMAPQKALAALQAAAPADLMPYEAAYLEPGAPAATVAFPVSVYRARIDWGDAGAQGRVPGAGAGVPEGVPGAGALPMPETIELERKKGTKTYRVAQFVHTPPAVDEAGEVTFALRILPSGALRADVFVRSCLESLTRTCTAAEKAAALAYNGSAPKLLELTRIEQRER